MAIGDSGVPARCRARFSKWCLCLALTLWDKAWGWAVRVLFKCPFAVASELGIYFLTIREVSRGNWLSPDKNPFSTACKNVVGGGFPQHAWMNCTNLALRRVSSCNNRTRTGCFGIGCGGSSFGGCRSTAASYLPIVRMSLPLYGCSSCHLASSSSSQVGVDSNAACEK